MGAVLTSGVVDTSDCVSHLESVSDYDIFYPHICHIEAFGKQLFDCCRVLCQALWAEARKQSTIECQKKIGGMIVACEEDEGAVEEVDVCKQNVLLCLQEMKDRLVLCDYVIRDEQKKKHSAIIDIISPEQVEEFEEGIDAVQKKLYDYHCALEAYNKQPGVHQIREWISRICEQGTGLIVLLRKSPQSHEDYLRDIEAISNIEEKMKLRQLSGSPKVQCDRLQLPLQEIHSDIVDTLNSIQDFLLRWLIWWRLTKYGGQDVLVQPEQRSEIAYRLQRALHQLLSGIYIFEPNLLQYDVQESGLSEKIEQWINKMEKEPHHQMEDSMENAERCQKENLIENRMEETVNCVTENFVEKKLKEIYDLESRLLLMTAPIFGFFEDYVASIKVIGQAITCIEVSCVALIMVERSGVEYCLDHYHSLCNTLCNSLKIIRQEYSKWYYSLRDKINKQEKLGEALDEKKIEVKNWIEKGAYCDIVNSVNLLQDEMPLIAQQRQKEIVDEMKEIKRYEMNARMMMVYV